MASQPPDSGDVAAAANGSRRQALEALRDRLARDIDAASPNVVAQISAQFRATLKEIAELPDDKKVTTADELRDRRENRRAAAAARALASGESN